jgi:hypothetical protein
VGIKMPIHRILDDGAFDHVAVHALTSAFEEASAALSLNDRFGPGVKY